MIRPLSFVLSAALIVAGAWVVAVPAGLIAAGVAVALLGWLFEEVGDAKD